MKYRPLTLLLKIVLLILLVWAIYAIHSYWPELMISMLRIQAILQQQLSHTVNVVAAHGWQASWSLIGISLLYGVFHAAGPGHGKAVIATYLGSSRSTLQRGIYLSLLSALMQGLVAIVLVEILMGVLAFSFRQTTAKANQLESISFALIAILGLGLALRSALSLYRFWQTKHAPASQKTSLFSATKNKTGRLNYQAYCVECGGPHSINQQHLRQAPDWRNTLSIILTVGLRPCTGAILVLLVANSVQLRWAGIAAVIAMSIGTAATVSVLAIAAVTLRQGLLRFLQRKQSTHAIPVLELLGVLGGLLLLAMGVDLLLLNQATLPHPLL